MNGVSQHNYWAEKAYGDGKEAGRNEYKKHVVMESSVDEVPFFTQGYHEHELLEIVTAERCNWLVNRIVQLENKLKEYGIS